MQAGQQPLMEAVEEGKREVRMIQEVLSLWSKKQLIPQKLRCLLKLSFFEKVFKILLILQPPLWFLLNF